VECGDDNSENKRFCVYVIGSWIKLVGHHGDPELIQAPGQVIKLAANGPILAALYITKDGIASTDRVTVSLRVWYVGSGDVINKEEEHCILYTRLLHKEYAMLYGSKQLHHMHCCVLSQDKVITISDTRCDIWSQNDPTLVDGMMAHGEIPEPVVTCLRTNDQGEFVTVLRTNIMLWRLTDGKLQFQYAAQPEWTEHPNTKHHRFTCGAVHSTSFFCGTSGGSIIQYDLQKSTMIADITIENNIPIDHIYIKKWMDEVWIGMEHRLICGQVILRTGTREEDIGDQLTGDDVQQIADKRIQYSFFPYQHLKHEFGGRILATEFNEDYVILNSMTMLWQVPLQNTTSIRKKKLAQFHNGSTELVVATQTSLKDAELAQFPHLDDTDISQNTGLIATGDENGHLKFWSEKRMKNDVTCPAPCRALTFLHLHPQYVVGAFDDGYIRVTDLIKQMPVGKCIVMNGIKWIQSLYNIASVLCATVSGELALLHFQLHDKDGNVPVIDQSKQCNEVGIIKCFKVSLRTGEDSGSCCGVHTNPTHICATFETGKVWIFTSTKRPTVIQVWSILHPTKSLGDCSYNAIFLDDSHLIGAADNYVFVYNFLKKESVSRISVDEPIHRLICFDPGEPVYILQKKGVSEILLNEDWKLLGNKVTISGGVPQQSDILDCKVLQIRDERQLIFLFQSGICVWRCLRT